MTDQPLSATPRTRWPRAAAAVAPVVRRVPVRLALRVGLPTVLTFLLVAWVTFVVTLPSMRDSLMRARRQLVQEQVRSVLSLCDELHRRELDGRLTRAEAQHRAAEMVRTLRYGPTLEEYLFVVGLDGQSIVHPLRTGLEGTDVSGVTDPTGRYYIREFITVAREQQAGFIDYQWYARAGSTERMPKLAYVAHFVPWGWVVGTGVYVDDVRREVAEATRRVLAIDGVILGLVFLLGAAVVWYGARAEQRRSTAERALAISEQKYRTLFESSQDAILIVSPKGWRYCDANRAAVELFGASSREDLLGRTVDEVSPQVQPDGRASHARMIGVLEAAMASGGGRIEWLHRRLDGVTFDSTMLVTRVEVAGEPMLQATIRDVTEQVRAQRALRESEERLRITLDSIGDAVIATDLDGRVVRMNPVAGRLTGWPQDEAAGRRLVDVLRIVDSATRAPRENPVTAILRAGGVVGLTPQAVLIARDGREIRVADSGAPIRDSRGQPVGVVVVFRDVTEQCRMEEQLQQIQRLDAIGQLAGGVAHDLNNMLGAVFGAVDLLGDGVRQRPDLLEYVRVIEGAASQAAVLTRKLQSFARPPGAHLAPIDLHQVVADTIQLLERSIDRRIVIETDLRPGDATVMGDPAQLGHALLNLALNARDAMPEGGHLRFASREVRLDEAFCSASGFPAVPGQYIELTVSDTGVGIPPEHLGRIFEPFFTTKAMGRGAGLGLAVVYGTVKGHRGIVLVDSVVGRGTRFRLFLALAEIPASERTESAASVDLAGRTILLVEDEAVMRGVGIGMLGQMQVRVITANDGREGVEAYRARRDEIDLVMMDLMMPVMSGAEAFRHMKAFDPSVRVLFVSGYASDDEMAGLLSDPSVVGYLQKPYRRQGLRRLLLDAFRTPRPRAS